MGRRKSSSVTLAGTRSALAHIDRTQVETLGRQNDPSPERLARAGYTVAIQLGTGNIQVVGAPRPVIGFDGIVRVSQAPLDRLTARSQLDPDSADRNHLLFLVGDKLRDHHHLAGLSGFAANDLLGSSGGGHPSNRTPITETRTCHRRAVGRAESKVDKGDWRVVRDVVLEERILEEVGRAVGFGERHAAAAVALDRLRRGLAVLAELWGYLPPERSDQAQNAASNDVEPCTSQGAADATGAATIAA